MKEETAYKNLPLLLSQVRETLISHFRPILSRFGLTEQQWRIIRVLHEAERLEPREICSICHIFSASLTGILKRMEEMKLINRHPIPGDKRRIHISLTKKSNEMVIKITPLIYQQYKYIEKAYGEKLMNQLCDISENFIALHSVEVEQIDLPKDLDI